MKTIKIETWLPLFPGFYNTVYSMDDDGVLEGYNENDKPNPIKYISLMLIINWCFTFTNWCFSFINWF